jgi:hypothetical protein
MSSLLSPRILLTLGTSEFISSASSWTERNVPTVPFRMLQPPLASSYDLLRPWQAASPDADTRAAHEASLRGTGWRSPPPRSAATSPRPIATIIDPVPGATRPAPGSRCERNRGRSHRNSSPQRLPQPPSLPIRQHQWLPTRHLARHSQRDLDGTGQPLPQGDRSSIPIQLRFTAAPTLPQRGSSSRRSSASQTRL